MTSLYLSRRVAVSYDLSLGYALRTWDNQDLLELIERRMPSVLWLEFARRANVRDISGSDLERSSKQGQRNKRHRFASIGRASHVFALPYY